jgi:hypothetical protein
VKSAFIIAVTVNHVEERQEWSSSGMFMVKKRDETLGWG